MTVNTNSTVDIEQDYVDLFSYKKQGHMAKYVHMFRPYIYEEIINQDSYYPFKMECDIISQKADYICNNLKNIKEIYEIGPGTSTPILHKTIPLLKYLQKQNKFTTYKALDMNLEYADDACQIIKHHFNEIKTEAIKVDFLANQKINLLYENSVSKDRKVLLAFGQAIFANNDAGYTKTFLNNIGKILNPGDYLLFGTDINQDQVSLEAAYNNELVYELLLNVMHYLKEQFQLKDFHPDTFNLIYRWNDKKSTVELFLKAMSDQKFKLGNKELVIVKDQEYNILNSRKASINTIKKLLDEEKLIIDKTINIEGVTPNKFTMIIAQKR